MLIKSTDLDSDISSDFIGPRSTVYTGPDEVAGAKWELERDTEKFIQVAEVHPQDVDGRVHNTDNCRNWYFHTRGSNTMFSSYRPAFLTVEWKILSSHLQRRRSFRV